MLASPSQILLPLLGLVTIAQSKATPRQHKFSFLLVDSKSGVTGTDTTSHLYGKQLLMPQEESFCALISDA